MHRDIKPSNVLLTRPRRPGGPRFAYLGDFGIARPLLDSPSGPLTRSGTTIGTLAYMAPERFLDRPIDARVDVYSLACLLYECLAGRKPFPGSEVPALMHGHLSVPPPRPSEHADVPVALDEVVARGMAKDPGARYPSAGELAAAARAAVDSAAPARASVVPRGTATGVPPVARPPATVFSRTWDDAAVIRPGSWASIAPGVRLAVIFGGVALLLVVQTPIRFPGRHRPGGACGRRRAAWVRGGRAGHRPAFTTAQRGVGAAPPDLQAGERAIAKGFASLLGSIARFGCLYLTDRRLMYRDCRPGSRRAQGFDLRLDEIQPVRSSGLRIDTTGPRRESIHLVVDEPAEWLAAIKQVTG